MRLETLRKQFASLYKDLTDPDTIQENKRRADRKKRLEDKKRDTGL